MVAVFTWSASTFVFQSVNDSDVVEGDELGVNSNNSVASNPMSHTKCNHRGAGVRAGALGGSLGGPDFAGAERCTWNDDMAIPGFHTIQRRGCHARSRRVIER